VAVTSAVTGQPVEACEYGPSGYCEMGHHAACEHRPGGAHEAGHEAPAAYLTVRPRGRRGGSGPGSWMCVGPKLWLECRVCGRRHGHVWRCPCDCHSPEGIAAAAAAREAARLAVDEQLSLPGWGT
jgi:hypothetical protein